MKFPIQLILAVVLTTITAFAQPQIGIAKPELVGPYQPFTADEAFSLLLEELRERAPNVEFVVVDATGVEFENAAALGKAHGLDYLMWGSLRFKNQPPTVRAFEERPVKNTVSAEVDIKIYSVEREQFVLRQPTWVSADTWSSKARKELSDKDLAEDCIERAAEALVSAVRMRADTGWFQRH